VFNFGDGDDLISDFTVGWDYINLEGTNAFDPGDLFLSDIRINGVLSTEIDYGSGTIKLYGVDQDHLHANGFSDFIFA
jgi:hypothetical protein